ncbi:MAG: polysaccharide biosynthesis tyrosine autokinase [Actinomycetota bacterium]|nr:polysaccharide biosynthesis tyrosine autokinase [Actinomycetota bacterium]
MTLRAYLHVLREQWLLVTAGLVFGLLVAGIVTMATPPRYSADVTLFVSAQNVGGDTTDAYQGNLLSEQKVQSYVLLFSSERISRDVIEQLGLEMSPEELAGQISATAEPDTVLLTATVTDTEPHRAQRIANAVGDAFIRLVAELERPDPGPPPPPPPGFIISPPPVEPVPPVSARLVEPADMPTSPVSPRPMINLALGAVVGLLVGYGAGLLRHTLDTSVKSTEQLQELTRTPVLGSIAYDPNVPSRPLIVHEQLQSPRAEAFRQIRTNLQFIDVDRSRKSFLVTSPLAGEGKTTTLCNLAIALAQANSRVVLVGADLRRPQAAQYLGLEGAIGVTSVLIGRVPLPQAVQPWGGGMFDVLASGPIPPNPSELLGSRQMADLLDELSASYDVVLIDTPPLLPVTDAAALAPRTDGALLVVRHGKTTRAQVEAAVTALESASGRLLGTILTMTPRSGRRSPYHYYYSSEPGSSQPGQQRHSPGDAMREWQRSPVPPPPQAGQRPVQHGDDRDNGASHSSGQPRQPAVRSED